MGAPDPNPSLTEAELARIESIFNRADIDSSGGLAMVEFEYMQADVYGFGAADKDQDLVLSKAEFVALSKQYEEPSALTLPCASASICADSYLLRRLSKDMQLWQCSCRD